MFGCLSQPARALCYIKDTAASKTVTTTESPSYLQTYQPVRRHNQQWRSVISKGLESSETWKYRQCKCCMALPCAVCHTKHWVKAYTHAQNSLLMVSQVLEWMPAIKTNRRHIRESSGYISYRSSLLKKLLILNNLWIPNAFPANIVPSSSLSPPGRIPLDHRVHLVRSNSHHLQIQHSQFHLLFSINIEIIRFQSKSNIGI